MVFNVNMVTFQMTFLVNKFTNTVMNDGRVYPLAKTIPSSQQCAMKYCHGYLKFG